VPFSISQRVLKSPTQGGCCHDCCQTLYRRSECDSRCVGFGDQDPPAPSQGFASGARDALTRLTGGSPM
jgi:hypothetical protein